MKDNSKGLIFQNNVFLAIGVATFTILAVPLSMEWDWGIIDYLVSGLLLFGTGSLFVLTARKIKTSRGRMIALLAFLLVTLFVWAELAVGIFTNLGN